MRKDFALRREMRAKEENKQSHCWQVGSTGYFFASDHQTFFAVYLRPDGISLDESIMT